MLKDSNACQCRAPRGTLPLLGTAELKRTLWPFHKVLADVGSPTKLCLEYMAARSLQSALYDGTLFLCVIKSQILLGLSQSILGVLVSP